MKNFIILSLISTCLSCTAMYGSTPDPKFWRQDNLYCWHRTNVDTYWSVKGSRENCPDGTFYSSTPPNFDE